MAGRGEEVRLGGLQHQQGRSDRTDAGDLRQFPADGVLAMPGLELLVDLRHGDLDLGQLGAEVGEQLPRQLGHARVLLDARQQRPDRAQPLGRDQAELRREAADPVGQPGLVAHQPSRRLASISAACRSALLTGTNCMVGRLIASQPASASRASFLPRLR